MSSVEKFQAGELGGTIIFWVTLVVVICVIGLILNKIVNKSKKTNTEPEIENPNGVWECPSCKNKNPNTTFRCESCGYKLI